MDFNITCEKGITYTDPETFVEDFYGNNDNIDCENYSYLENYVWEWIEATNGRIPSYVWDIISDLMEDFIWDNHIDDELIEYDLEDGRETIRRVIVSPNMNYFATILTQNRWGDREYLDCDFTKVKKAKKVVETWEEV